MFPTSEDYDFYCKKCSPKWAKDFDNGNQEKSDIDSVINSHARPEFKRGAFTQSQEWRTYRNKQEPARITHNLMMLCKSARKRGELITILKKVYKNPQGLHMKKRKAMAKKWLIKMNQFISLKT